MMRQKNRAKALMKDLAEEAIQHHVMLFDGRGKPGEIILRLSAEKRKILAGLKSNDILDARWNS